MAKMVVFCKSYVRKYKHIRYNLDPYKYVWIVIKITFLSVTSADVSIFQTNTSFAYVVGRYIPKVEASG